MLQFRVSVLLSLLTAAAAQQYYYCDSPGKDSIGDSDFYLITTRQGESGYPAGLNCQFSALSNTAAFLVELKFVYVRDAVLTISSGGQTLFRGSRVQSNESSIVTTSRLLQVRFDASWDNSYLRGVQMRVRSLNYNGCPPGWTYLQGNCFGTSTTSGPLNFLDAQKACNSMRANLMQLPASYHGTVRSFVSLLPKQLTSQYTWIGLTDRAAQFSHYWLNGNWYYVTEEISCESSGGFQSCYWTERCGTIYDKSYDTDYGIYMANCNYNKPYVCSMPPGGTGLLYTVPNLGITTTTAKIRTTTRSLALIPGLDDVSIAGQAWRLGISLGCTFVVGIIVCLCVLCAQSRRRANAAGATGVTVTSGRVMFAPPPNSNPDGPTAQYSNLQAPAYRPTPFSNDTAIADGYFNSGYKV